MKTVGLIIKKSDKETPEEKAKVMKPENKKESK